MIIDQHDHWAEYGCHGDPDSNDIRELHSYIATRLNDNRKIPLIQVERKTPMNHLLTLLQCDAD